MPETMREHDSITAVAARGRQVAIKAPRGMKTCEVGEEFAKLCLINRVHPSRFQLDAFLAQYDQQGGIALDDVRQKRVNPKSMLPRDVQGKSELRVELSCKANAFKKYRFAAERMIALVAGRPLSSSLDDGIGEMHAEAVVEFRRLVKLVEHCEWNKQSVGGGHTEI